MSFMIDEDDVEEAMRSLHAVFFVDPDPSIFDVSARKQAAAIGTELNSGTTQGSKRAFVTMIFLILGRGKTGSSGSRCGERARPWRPRDRRRREPQCFGTDPAHADPVGRRDRLHHPAGSYSRTCAPACPMARAWSWAPPAGMTSSTTCALFASGGMAPCCMARTSPSGSR